ncbi:MAG: hypothetical protein JNK58_12540 [Phycisphaerae bacterium]|nr:hypothetical protein [Phycisphaerae bacterium]
MLGIESRESGHAMILIRRSTFFGVLLLLGVVRGALGISFGSTTTDSRFAAVCGLAPRARDADSAWFPDGSGTYIQWTDPQNNQRVGIVTVQHFLDGNANPSGNCDSQQNLWYAYFQGCPEVCNNCPCLPLCVGENEDMIRVRIKCFSLATAPYRELLGSIPDGVVIGEIEPDDLCFLSHITPIQMETPSNLGLCAGQTVRLAGWGRTRSPVPNGIFTDPCDPVDPEFEARSLHVGLSILSYIGCSKDGRTGTIKYETGGWSHSIATCSPYAGVECHDSGGALLVDIPGGQLRLIGVFSTPGSAYMVQRHQSISAPTDPTFLCRPCRPAACGDIDGDSFHRQNCDDRDCLDALGEWEVNPWCLGDMDGDRIAGTKLDVDMIKCDPGGNPVFCDRNQWCWGDANLDGYVDSADLQLIRDINGGGSVACPSCGACGEIYEWCRGDVNLMALSTWRTRILSTDSMV